MPTENRLISEIKKIIKENVPKDYLHDFEINDLSLALYSLNEEVSNEYYNQMKVNKGEFGTTARFNHWASNIYKKEK